MRKPCCAKQENNKGAWSKQEDKKLVDYIRENGEGCWRNLPQAAGLLRCGKSCRLRWINYLRPDLKRGNFGEDEEDLIIKLHALLGNRWSLIAGRLPGRTDNEVKNYWNSHLSRKLMKIGVDPNNHRLTKKALPRPRPSIKHGTSRTTSGSSKQDHICQPLTAAQVQITNHPTINSTTNNNDQVSYARSCFSEHAGQDDLCLGRLPDLNLDLTISVNHQSHSLDQKPIIRRDCYDNHKQPSASASSPLLLFS